MTNPRTIQDRFDRSWELGPPPPADPTLGPCHLWKLVPRTNGYPVMGIKNGDGVMKMRGAHRVSWELAHGPIPEGHEVHHRCNVRLCVNVEHLESVDPVGHKRLHLKGHCKNGHEFTPENTYRNPKKPGTRVCRACVADRVREYRGRALTPTATVTG